MLDTPPSSEAGGAISPGGDPMVKVQGFVQGYLLRALRPGDGSSVPDSGSWSTGRDADIRQLVERLLSRNVCAMAHIFLGIERIPDAESRIKEVLKDLFRTGRSPFDEKSHREGRKAFRDAFLQRRDRLAKMVEEAWREAHAEPEAPPAPAEGGAHPVRGPEEVIARLEPPPSPPRPRVPPTAEDLAARFIRKPETPPEPIQVNLPEWPQIRASLEQLAATRESLRGHAEGLCAGMRAYLDQGKRPIIGEKSAAAPGGKVLILGDADIANGIWFLGDIHGDLPAFEAALSYIDAAHRKEHPESRPAILFLGDFFDDGPLGYEVLLRLFQLLLEREGSVCVLAGNHDEALKYDEKADRFHSGVSPCEFSEQLEGELRGDRVAREVGKLAARLFEITARAALLPGGLLAAHGGVPHSDLSERLESLDAIPLAELERGGCLQDFVWTRLHERAPRRIPNRGSKSCELGHLDFFRFCWLTENILGLASPVVRMVRGHDHLESRFKYFSNYGNRVLTLNTMCSKLDREWDWGTGNTRTPCLARYGPGEGMPRVHMIRIPETLAKSAYSPPPAGARPDSDGR
jgi:hypothetical protein